MYDFITLNKVLGSQGSKFWWLNSLLNSFPITTPLKDKMFKSLLHESKTLIRGPISIKYSKIRFQWNFGQPFLKPCLKTLNFLWAGSCKTSNLVSKFLKFKHPGWLKWSISFTSKSRASRLAEVSSYKKRVAFGFQKQVLPIGAAPKPHTASQLCSRSSTSFCLIPFQLWPPRLSCSHTALLNFCNSFQQLPTALKVVPSLPPSPQLFSLLLCFSQLSPTTLASSSLFSTFLDSLQLFFNSPAAPLNSSHLFLSPSQLFSPPVRKMLTQRAMSRRSDLCKSFSPVEVTQLQTFFFSSNAFLKRVAMNVSSTAARSSQGAWQPDQDQSC